MEAAPAEGGGAAAAGGPATGAAAGEAGAGTGADEEEAVEALEAVVLRAGFRAMHEAVGCEDLMAFPRRLLRQSFFERMLGKSKMDLVDFPAPDISAAQPDVKHLSLCQLLYIHCRNAEGTPTRGSDAVNFLGAVKSAVALKLSERLSGNPDCQVDIDASAADDVLHSVALCYGARTMLTQLAADYWLLRSKHVPAVLSLADCQLRPLQGFALPTLVHTSLSRATAAVSGQRRKVNWKVRVTEQPAEARGEQPRRRREAGGASFARRKAETEVRRGEVAKETAFVAASLPGTVGPAAAAASAAAAGSRAELCKLRKELADSRADAEKRANDAQGLHAQLSSAAADAQDAATKAELEKTVLASRLEAVQTQAEERADALRDELRRAKDAELERQTRQAAAADEERARARQELASAEAALAAQREELVRVQEAKERQEAEKQAALDAKEEELTRVQAEREKHQAENQVLASLAADEPPERAAERLAPMFASRPRVCVLGSTEFRHGASQEIVFHLARELSERLGGTSCFLTGGMPGVQEAFAEGCLPAVALFHVLPFGQTSGFAQGADLHAGVDLAARRAVFGILGDVYVTIEGGPGVSEEARLAAERGAAVVPVRCTGGASSGMFGFPASALERPRHVRELLWRTLGDEAAAPADVASAAAAVVQGHVEASSEVGSWSSPSLDAESVPSPMHAPRLSLSCLGTPQAVVAEAEIDFAASHMEADPEAEADAGAEAHAQAASDAVNEAEAEGVAETDSKPETDAESAGAGDSAEPQHGGSCLAAPPTGRAPGSPTPLSPAGSPFAGATFAFGPPERAERSCQSSPADMVTPGVCVSPRSAASSADGAESFVSARSDAGSPLKPRRDDDASAAGVSELPGAPGGPTQVAQ